MAKINNLEEIVKQTLMPYTEIPFAFGDIRTEAIFDLKNNRYILVNIGWENEERVYFPLIQIDIIEDKIHIQTDNTEHGIASELVEAGIPKNKIVLSFQPYSRREMGEFALI